MISKGCYIWLSHIHYRPVNPRSSLVYFKNREEAKEILIMRLIRQARADFEPASATVCTQCLIIFIMARPG